MSDLLNTANDSETTLQRLRHQDDGFLASLAALRQLTSSQQHQQRQEQPVVQLLQREKQALERQLDNERILHRNSLKDMQQTLTDLHCKHYERVTKQLEDEKKSSSDKISHLHAALEKTRMQLEEATTEKESVLLESRKEREILEESMIALERENDTLKERCIQVDTTSAKLQAEVNDRIAAFEQSKVALQKIRKLLGNAESNASEISSLKQKLNMALSEKQDFQYKLDDKERELIFIRQELKSALDSVRQQANAWESKLHEKDDKARDKLNQNVRDKEEAYATLEATYESETSELQSHLAQKEALLQAKEKMIKLLTAKTKTLDSTVARNTPQLDELATKQASEIEALQAELEEVKDELKCAEEEVSRCRVRIKELELQVDTPMMPSAGTTICEVIEESKSGTEVAASDDPVDAVVMPMSGDNDTSSRKRKAGLSTKGIDERGIGKRS